MLLLFEVGNVGKTVVFKWKLVVNTLLLEAEGTIEAWLIAWVFEYVVEICLKDCVVTVDEKILGVTGTFLVVVIWLTEVL